jgi:voltage-gated potassium channel
MRLSSLKSFCHNLIMKNKIYEIIFLHETRAGKLFDLWLIILVMISIMFVMLETVESLAKDYGSIFITLEWFFTILFSAELLLRLYCAPSKAKYIFSFYGLVDIVSILPTYISILIPGAQSFLIVRALRILRIFRILKLKNYTQAGQTITSAIVASMPKIIVFLGFITTLVLIMGSLMYLIEGKESGYTSIPKAAYWAIVTMTTVGYGDITPQTPLGQIISSLLMIAGYAIIAVPTGIISVEMNRQADKANCNKCNAIVMDAKANYCSRCGERL